jgi:hypothetical protein
MMVRTAERGSIAPVLFKYYEPRNKYKIPIFPHLKKFLNKQYGFNVKKPIQIDEHSSIGKLVMLALRDKRFSSEYNDQYRNKLTTEIVLRLSKEMVELSPQISKLMKINISIDELFKSHLIAWINGQLTTGIPAYTSCKYFLQFYNIEEKEYSLDAAYKYWQRFNKHEG